MLALVVLVPASSAWAAIDFRGDFEDGGKTPAGRGWWLLQHEFDRPVGETFERVTGPVRQGRYAARFSVRHGYSPYGWNESTEVSWRPDKDQGPGSEYYYAFSTLFPRDFHSVRGWGLFLQFYTERFNVFLGSPPIGLDAKEDRIRVHVRTGRATVKGESPRTFGFAKSFLVSPTLNLGIWNDFVIRARWAADTTGILEIWHRAGDRSFRKAVSLHGIPTLRWHPSYGVDRIGAIKIGLYRKSNCAVPVRLGCTGDHGVQGTSVLYHDGFTRGRTFEEVAHAAFGDKAVSAVPPAKKSAPKKARKKAKRAAALPKGRLALRQPRTVVDPGCRGCSVALRGGEIVATVPSGADASDTAYRLVRFAGVRGAPGRIVASARIGLARGHVPSRNLAVLQMRDRLGRLVYELYVAGADRTLRLWSPPGGLRAASINESTGVVVPNDGSSRVNVSVSALRNRSVVVRVGGKARTSVGGLAGASTGNPRFVRAGIDHYDAAGSSGPVTVTVERLAVRR